MILGRPIHAGDAAVRLKPPWRVGENDSVSLVGQRSLPRAELGLAPGASFSFLKAAGINYHDFASPQFMPMCGSTRPLTGAPENVSAKASIIALFRSSAACSADSPATSRTIS